MVGTKDSEVLEVTVQDKDNPRIIVQVDSAAVASSSLTRCITGAVELVMRHRAC